MLPSLAVKKESPPGPLDFADDHWSSRLPGKLTGNLGRKPTKTELRVWKIKSTIRKRELIRLKAHYLATGRKLDMIAYFELRVSCGYIEGVPIPKWLWDVRPALADPALP
jgi:hypothetical protein